MKVDRSRVLAGAGLVVLALSVGAIAMWAAGAGLWAPHYKDMLGKWWNIDPARRGDWLQITYTGKTEGVETYDIVHSGGRTQTMFGGGGLWWEKPSSSDFFNRTKAEFDDHRDYTIALLDTTPAILAVWGDPTKDVYLSWAATKLADRCDTLSRAEGDSRRDLLRRAAVNLGQMVGAGVLDRTEVAADLYTACRFNRLTTENEAWVLEAIESGIEEGMRRSINPPTGISGPHLLARFARKPS